MCETQRSKSCCCCCCSCISRRQFNLNYRRYSIKSGLHCVVLDGCCCCFFLATCEESKLPFSMGQIFFFSAYYSPWLGRFWGGQLSPHHTTERGSGNFPLSAGVTHRSVALAHARTHAHHPSLAASLHPQTHKSARISRNIPQYCMRPAAPACIQSEPPPPPPLLLTATTTVP